MNYLLMFACSIVSNFGTLHCIRNCTTELKNKFNCKFNDVVVSAFGDTIRFSGSPKYAELKNNFLLKHTSDLNLEFINVTIKDLNKTIDCKSLTLTNVLWFVLPITIINTTNLTTYNTTFDGDGIDLLEKYDLIFVRKDGLLEISHSAFINLHNFGVFLKCKCKKINIAYSTIENNKIFNFILSYSTMETTISHSRIQRNRNFQVLFSGTVQNSLVIENCLISDNHNFGTFLAYLEVFDIAIDPPMFQFTSNIIKHNFGKSLLYFFYRSLTIHLSNNVYIMNALSEVVTSITIKQSSLKNHIQIFKENYKNNFAKQYYHVTAEEHESIMIINESCFEIYYPISSCDNIIQINEFINLQAGNLTFNNLNEMYSLNFNECYFAHSSMLKSHNITLGKKPTCYNCKKISMISLAVFLLGAITSFLLNYNLKLHRGNSKINTNDAILQTFSPDEPIINLPQVEENYYDAPFQDIRI